MTNPFGKENSDTYKIMRTHTTVFLGPYHVTSKNFSPTNYYRECRDPYPNIVRFNFCTLPLISGIDIRVEQFLYVLETKLYQITKDREYPGVYIKIECPSVYVARHCYDELHYRIKTSRQSIIFALRFAIQTSKIQARISMVQNSHHINNFFIELSTVVAGLSIIFFVLFC